MEKRHIVCFGDSNTHGYRASDDGRYDEQERWTCLLQKQLGDGYLIIEEGLSGRTTCFSDPIHEGLSGLDYIYPCLMSHEPVDLLVIMLGTNDTKERFGASAACIALGLKRLIAKAASTLMPGEQAGPTSWWSHPSPLTSAMRPPRSEKPWVWAAPRNQKAWPKNLKGLHP